MTRKAYFNKHILLEHVLEAERIQSKTVIQPKWPEGGPLGGPLGDLPFTVKETESSTGQKWKSPAQPWGTMYPSTVAVLV